MAEVSTDSFKVSIIPHTLKETVLGVKKVGDIVNLETDVIGKYVKKLLDSQTTNAGLTKEMLLANGFY